MRAAPARPSDADLALTALLTVLFYLAVIPASSGLARTLYVILLLRGILEGTYLVFDAALDGAGDTRFTMGAEIAVEAFVWAPVVFLVRTFSPSVPVLYLIMPFWLAVGSAVLAVRWKSGRWLKNALV